MSKDEIDILKKKVFCQNVELTELKDSHNKKVNSYNVEKENHETIVSVTTEIIWAKFS